jgi:hypothetical protein
MVTAQVVVSLLALMPMLAVVADGGLLLVERRHAQATADAAALAAASDIYAKWYTNSSSDPDGTASASAMGVASANGYTNDGTTSTVKVNIPPSSSVNFNGKAGYAEVILTWNQQRFFSGVFGSGAIPVSARAVAQGVVQQQPQPSQPPQQPVAVLLLNPNAIPPSSALNVTGGQVVVGSTASPQLPDFLSYLPSPPSASNAGSGVTVDSTTYANGMSGTVNLTSNAPTIYIVGGNGIDLKGIDTVTGTNVMIYLTGSAGVNLTDNSSVSLTPMSTGTYAGLSIFQDRNDSTGWAVQGNGTLNATGTIYAPAASIVASGSGGYVGSQIIAQSLTTQGSGTVNVNFGGPSGTLRNFGLVE